jgi:hypothetical protein
VGRVIDDDQISQVVADRIVESAVDGQVLDVSGQLGWGIGRQCVDAAARLLDPLGG